MKRRWLMDPPLWKATLARCRPVREGNPESGHMWAQSLVEERSGRGRGRDCGSTQV